MAFGAFGQPGGFGNPLGLESQPWSPNMTGGRLAPYQHAAPGRAMYDLASGWQNQVSPQGGSQTFGLLQGQSPPYGYMSSLGPAPSYDDYMRDRRTAGWSDAGGGLPSWENVGASFAAGNLGASDIANARSLYGSPYAPRPYSAVDDWRQRNEWSQNGFPSNPGWPQGFNPPPPPAPGASDFARMRANQIRQETALANNSSPYRLPPGLRGTPPPSLSRSNILPFGFPVNYSGAMGPQNIPVDTNPYPHIFDESGPSVQRYGPSSWGAPTLDKPATRTGDWRIKYPGQMTRQQILNQQASMASDFSREFAAGNVNAEDFSTMRRLSDSLNRPGFSDQYTPAGNIQSLITPTAYTNPGLAGEAMMRGRSGQQYRGTNPLHDQELWRRYDDYQAGVGGYNSIFDLFSEDLPPRYNPMAPAGRTSTAERMTQQLTPGFRPPPAAARPAGYQWMPYIGPGMS